jgi:uncharacterized protein (TIGR02996 family)
MPDANAFLRAIVDDPDDDAPRLVYADWLEENGDQPRAEFIRVQCALTARAGEESPDLRHLHERDEDLRNRHAAEWTPRIPPLRRSLRVVFRRGFVEEVTAEARAFVAGADELFRLAPVRHVRLLWGADAPHERARFMQIVSAVPQLARLHSLDLSDGFIGSDGVQALSVCEYLAGLESLDLRGGHVGERGVRALVEAPWFANLSYLNLSDNDINAGAVHAIGVRLDVLYRAGQLKLRQLPLEGNPLRSAGTRVIRSSRVLRRVVRL